MQSIWRTGMRQCQSFLCRVRLERSTNETRAAEKHRINSKDEATLSLSLRVAYGEPLASSSPKTLITTAQLSAMIPWSDALELSIHDAPFQEDLWDHCVNYWRCRSVHIRRSNSCNSTHMFDSDCERILLYITKWLAASSLWPSPWRSKGETAT